MFMFSCIQHHARHYGYRDELDRISTFEDFQIYKEKSCQKYSYDILLQIQLSVWICDVILRKVVNAVHKRSGI